MCIRDSYIGDVIKSRDALLVMKEETMRDRFRIDVRTRNEVLSIDREHKMITIKNHKDGTTYTETYDTPVSYTHLTRR